MLNEKECLMLIIDIQEKLLNAVFNKSQVEKNSKILSQAAELLEIPVIVTEQYPQGLGKTCLNLGNSTTFFEKTEFNAIANQAILDSINSTNKKQVIIFGIETHICVYQTVKALIDNGFQVIVAKDACGSRTEYQYYNGLETIKDDGAKLKTSEMILFELIKTSKHKHFKQIQELIK